MHHAALASSNARGMRVRCGTSGFSYTAWKGSFYPAGARTADLLSLYAARLPAVEINADLGEFKYSGFGIQHNPLV